MNKLFCLNFFSALALFMSPVVGHMAKEIMHACSCSIQYVVLRPHVGIFTLVMTCLNITLTGHALSV